MTAAPRLAELGLVEPAALRAVVDRTVQGLRIPFAALNELLGIEVWLYTRDDRPETWWAAPSRHALGAAGP